jgi:hypothetical protein
VISDWWAANRLEFVLGAVLLGLSALLWFGESIAEAIRERRQKRKDGLL